ncbi:MAG: peptidylprolyl isomerase [Candidatus Methylomirabilales bacterium]
MSGWRTRFRGGWAWGMSFLLLLCLVGTCGQAAAGPLVMDKVVALVNDEMITLSELQLASLPLIRRMALGQVGTMSQDRIQATQRDVLNDLILHRLMVQEAKRIGLNVGEREVQAMIAAVMQQNRLETDQDLERVLAQNQVTLKDFRRQIREGLLVNKLLVRRIRSAIIVSEEEIAAYYREHRDQFTRPPAVRLRHILIKVPPEASTTVREAARAKAEEALAKVRSGVPFPEVAKAYSDGITARDGGDLGLIKRGDFAPALEAVVFNLRTGETSEVLETAAGFNILQVVEAIPGEFSLDQARERIRDHLYDEKYRTQLEQYVKELRGKAFVEIKIPDAP